jgi:hypothetical protein
MTDVKKFAYVVVALLGAFWTTLVFAQVVPAPVDLKSLPWVSVLIAGGIALWGGLLVTLNRLDGLETREEFLKWLARDLVGAAVAGWFVFFFAAWMGWNVWVQALSLLAAGYGGSKVLDAASKRLIKTIKETE